MEFRSRKILKRLDPINISSFCISVSACKRGVRFIFKDPNINISITFACRLLFIRGVEIEYLLDSLEKIIHERSREYFSRVKTRLRWVILRFFLRNRPKYEFKKFFRLLLRKLSRVIRSNIADYWTMHNYTEKVVSCWSSSCYWSSLSAPLWMNRPFIKSRNWLFALSDEIQKLF